VEENNNFVTTQTHSTKKQAVECGARWGRARVSLERSKLAIVYLTNAQTTLINSSKQFNQSQRMKNSGRAALH